MENETQTEGRTETGAKYHIRLSPEQVQEFGHDLWSAYEEVIKTNKPELYLKSLSSGTAIKSESGLVNILGGFSSVILVKKDPSLTIVSELIQDGCNKSLRVKERGKTGIDLTPLHAVGKRYEEPARGIESNSYRD